MTKKKLFNPTDKDILDYRIAEAQLDSNGEPVFDNMAGDYKWTGETFEWSIKAGQTLEFPGYVADYLKKIYDFLEYKDEKSETSTPEEAKTGEIKEATVEEAKPQDGIVSCKYCGQNFKNTRALGLHIGSKHTEKIL